MIFLKGIRSAVRTPWKRTLYILFFAQLMTAVGFSSIFPFLPNFVKELGSSTGMDIDLLVGLVYSGQAFTMMLAAPIWGSVADRYGRKLMVERAMFGGSIILLLMAFSRSAEELVIIRAVQGLITGTVAAANALVASQAPREHTGYAMGLLMVGQGAGVAVGPLIGGAIADAYGYAAAFYVPGALLFIAGLLVFFGVQETFEPKPQTGKAKSRILSSWGEILSTKGVPVTYTISFLNQLGRNMLTPVLPLFIPMLLGPVDHANTYVGLVIGISAATTTLSGVYLGRLGDRLGHRRILIISMLIGGLLYIPTLWVTEAWQVLLQQAALGVAIGGMAPSLSALLARYTRPGAEGAVFGLDNSIGSGARSLAPMLGSAIMGAWGPRPAFGITGLMMALTSIFALMALPRRTDLYTSARQVETANAAR